MIEDYKRGIDIAREFESENKRKMIISGNIRKGGLVNIESIGKGIILDITNMSITIRIDESNVIGFKKNMIKLFHEEK